MTKLIDTERRLVAFAADVEGYKHRQGHGSRQENFSSFGAANQGP
jgi:hypothetical protein